LTHVRNYLSSGLVWYDALSKRTTELSRQFGSWLSNFLTRYVKKTAITSLFELAWIMLINADPCEQIAAIIEMRGDTALSLKEGSPATGYQCLLV
jgi:hypothetical protein